MINKIIAQFHLSLESSIRHWAVWLTRHSGSKQCRDRDLRLNKKARVEDWDLLKLPRGHPPPLRLWRTSGPPYFLLRFPDDPSFVSQRLKNGTGITRPGGRNVISPYFSNVLYQPNVGRTRKYLYFLIMLRTQESKSQGHKNSGKVNSYQ